MAAYVYANGQYHCLAGNKIVKDGALLAMKAADKIIVNGKAYNLDVGTYGSAEDGKLFDNGTEPTTGNVFYITPDGAGSMDGSSWANAASGSMIHVILLSCASGDSIYIAEGEYTTDRIMDIPSGVTIYGGFPAVNPTWETRNGFIYRSVFTGSSDFNMSTGGTVDGLMIRGYACTGISAYKNCISNVSFAGKQTNCIAINCKALYVFNSDKDAIENCMAINCEASENIFYAYHSTNIINCMAVNCEASENIFYNYFYSSNSGTLYTGYAINCTAVNCKANYIFSGRELINCLSWNNSGTEFSGTKTTCAGSVYDAALALVLGTDNSIARFTNTGFAPAQGIQNVGDCPIAAFGDWHPAANSFLLGAGTADSSVTTDADGVTRPDPPSIGAYEAR